MYLTVEAETDENELKGYSSEDTTTTVRISNEDAENGYISPSKKPLSWLNSARITADRDEDAVHCVISVDDPRGGFGFTVRRLPDGRIVLHVPYPGECMPHAPLAQLHDGTLVIVSKIGAAADQAVLYRGEDDEDDEDDDDDDDEDDEDDED